MVRVVQAAVLTSPGYLGPKLQASVVKKDVALVTCALPGEEVLTQTLTLQDRFPQDMEGAVAAVRSQGDTGTADLWQEALDNLTMGTPGDPFDLLQLSDPLDQPLHECWNLVIASTHGSLILNYVIDCLNFMHI